MGHRITVRQAAALDSHACKRLAVPPSLAFFVPGIPVPGGSKRAFPHAKTGRMVVIDMGKGNKAWRDRVAAFASVAMAGRDLFRGPLKVTLVFVVPRPKGHYGSGRNAGLVRASALPYPTVKPDALKLARAAEDALTGVVYIDDSQTVDLSVRKMYGGTPGVSVTIDVIEPRGEREGGS